MHNILLELEFKEGTELDNQVLAETIALNLARAAVTGGLPQIAKGEVKVLDCQGLVGGIVVASTEFRTGW